MNNSGEQDTRKWWEFLLSPLSPSKNETPNQAEARRSCFAIVSLVPASTVFCVALWFLGAGLMQSAAAWTCIFGGFLLTVLAGALMARMGEAHTKSDNTDVEDLLRQVEKEDLREKLRLKCVRHTLFLKERTQKIVHLFVGLLGATIWMGVVSALATSMASSLATSEYPKGPVLFFLGVFVVASAALPIVIANQIQNWHSND